MIDEIFIYINSWYSYLMSFYYSPSKPMRDSFNCEYKDLFDE